MRPNSSMAKRNITVAVDEGAYRRARLWAADNETSVSAVVEYCIQHLPGLQVTREAVADIHRRRHQRTPSGILTLARAARLILDDLASWKKDLPYPPTQKCEL